MLNVRVSAGCPNFRVGLLALCIFFRTGKKRKNEGRGNAEQQHMATGTCRESVIKSEVAAIDFCKPIFTFAFEWFPVWKSFLSGILPSGMWKAWYCVIERSLLALHYFYVFILA